MKILILLLFVLFFAGAPLVSADPLSDLQAAVIQQDYKTANRLAKDLLNDHLTGPQTQEVTYYLGLSHLRLGEYSRAQSIFTDLLKERLSLEMYDKTSVGLVDSLTLQEFYELALKETTAFLAKRKGSEATGLMLLKAARANLKLTRWTRARTLLQQLVSDYPGSFEADVARRLLDEKQYFTVQVGSFLDKNRAEKLVKELQDRKEYAYIVELKSAEGKLYYRVRVGQLAALKDAHDLEQKLSGLGYPTLIYP